VNLEKARLTRLPIPFELEDYELAAKEIEDALVRLPSVIAVYRTGSISTPGISDLDRIAVVRYAHSVREIWSTLSTRTRMVAMHTPFLVDEATFAMHRWFADLEPLELVHGEPISIEPRPASQHAERLIAAEALVVTTLKLYKQSFAGRVRVRPLLCELHNLERDLELARIGRAEAPRAWALAEYVNQVRQEWWSCAEQERLVRVRHLLMESLPATGDALQCLGGEESIGRPPGLRLAGEWRNVTLMPGDVNDTGRGKRGMQLLARLPKVAEARWRRVSRSITVPQPVISLLAGSSDACDQVFRTRRQKIVRRHCDLLAESPGYSGLGSASAFLVA
jgi:hypothetical protein